MRTISLPRMAAGFRSWWRAMVSQVAHGEVIRQVDDDGRLSYSYAFMVSASAGIATIGLLLNSPTVIVGAMLISPLMGPITLSGIAISLADPRKAAVGGFSLLVGILLSLAVSMAIVHLSPLHNATAEILARTHPNLFDLLVALFAGLAGGYAVIRGRGGAIVGVAIATALMPPLAVVGYGMATKAWPIAEGAFLMFVTNMFAIALAVAFMGTWYGFGRRGLRRRIAWQTLMAAIILVPLGIPLLDTLRTIAREASVTVEARNILQTIAARDPSGRLAQFEVGFPQGGPLQVSAVILTHKPDPKLDAEAEQALSRQLARPVRLSLDQLSSATIAPPVATVLAGPARPAAKAESAHEDIAAQLRKDFPLPVRLIDVDPAHKRITVMPAATVPTSLATLRAMETELGRHYPGWRVALIPPPQPFDPVRFAPGSSEIGAQQYAQVQDVAWALHAWEVGAVEVIGHASTSGRARVNTALAFARAGRVAALLREAGITATPVADYPATGQAALQRQQGLAAFRTVEIRTLAVQ